MDAIFSGVRSSQTSPAGRWGAGQEMTSSGVTIKEGSPQQRP